MMMLDPKDLAIRLFGRTIQLPQPQYDAVSGQSRSPPDAAPVLDCQPSSSESDHHLCSSNQTLSDKSCTDGGGSVDLKQQHGSSSVLENTSGGDETKSSPEGGTSGSHAKPTKILPCPRCNSSDTKFCYFNNYNVNQPRHLCKKCQRYWTAGGSMRSMVIGAGRRKSKTSCSSQQSYATPFRVHPDALLTLREDARKTASDSASISFQSFATLWPNPWRPDHQSSSVPPPAGFVPIYPVPPYWSCGALAWMPPVSASADQRPYSPLRKHPRDNKRTETKVLVVIKIDKNK